jgi:hypothetical protein
LPGGVDTDGSASTVRIAASAPAAAPTIAGQCARSAAIAPIAASAIAAGIATIRNGSAPAGASRPSSASCLHHLGRPALGGFGRRARSRACQTAPELARVGTRSETGPSASACRTTRSPPAASVALSDAGMARLAAASGIRVRAGR